MSTEKGRKAEDRAALYLRIRGYRIVDRNARAGRGELDIVAVKDGILAFIEVKMRPDRDAGLLSVHTDKQRRLRSAAAAWLVRHAAFQHLQCRYDLIILTPGRFRSRIEYLQDAFR